MGTDAGPGGAAAEVAATMAGAAADWLAALDGDQRETARWSAPGDDEATEAERLRWYYTPVDHGGLPLGRQQPDQQRLAMRLVAGGLSEAGYATVATILGWENVLDRVEGWGGSFGRERGRDPGLYYLRVFGEPGSSGPWGWRFGGHHVSLNVLVVDGAVRSTTPCFLGANPASAPALGGGTLRPLGRVEDLARELVRSLPPELRARAVLLDRPPADLVAGNRPRVADRPVPPAPVAEKGTGFDPADRHAVELPPEPEGVPGRELDAGQRELLAALLSAYRGRVPEGLAAPVDLDDVHLAWAGPLEPGQPHYHRLQGPRLLTEWDDTAGGAGHAHSVWRDPEADFGVDALAAHRRQHHAGERVRGAGR